MSVSSRLRYEILRRDNYTCRYCGGSAPDVSLTVDHVIPVTLGGGDDPSNLVAACSACNSGKSATPADAALVENVREDALRWSTAMAAVVEARTAELAANRTIADQFDSRWAQWATGSGPVPRETGWRDSVLRFYAAGLDEAFVDDAVHAAMNANRVQVANVWRYFCGICWRELDRRREMASQLLGQGADPPAITRKWLTQFPYMIFIEMLLDEIVAKMGGCDEAKKLVSDAAWYGMSNTHQVYVRQIESPEITVEEAGTLARETLYAEIGSFMDRLQQLRAGSAGPS